MSTVVVNARFYCHRATGMQRYALELVKRFGDRVETAAPRRALKGPIGHLWEQTFLPIACRGKLLWSPNNTGPIATRNQVCSCHDIIPLDHPEWFTREFSTWYEWLVPRLLRNVRHVIAVSEFTKQRIVDRTNISPDKVTVIPNGVTSEFVPQSEDDINRVRRNLRIGLRPYVVYVGSVEPRKNLARLLRSWNKLRGRIPEDLLLVIAGACGGRKVFSQVHLDDIPENVLFTGYVASRDLPALYSGALAAVYPSLYEGFGFPPLEAMACGTPVVTSNLTSIPEVIGNSGILVNPREEDSIAEGMLLVIDRPDLREQLRRAGRERARMFDWDRTAAETWRILYQHAN